MLALLTGVWDLDFKKGDVAVVRDVTVEDSFSLNRARK